MSDVPAEQPALHWVDSVASTQQALVERARSGAPQQALATTDQPAGHGRRGRSWQCPPGSGLALSVLLRPTRVDAWTWLPLLAGVATVEVLRGLGLEGAELKWPNDVLVDNRKIAGLVAERVEVVGGGPPAFVVGVGLNLRHVDVADATSLADHGVVPDPQRLARSLIQSLTTWVRRWQDEPVAVATAYRGACATVGRPIRVLLPGKREVVGVACAVDDDGCLVVDTGQASPVALSAGDVVHLRPR